MGNRIADQPMDSELREALQNADVLAIANDGLASMGTRLDAQFQPHNSSVDVWVRRLERSALSLLFWNKDTPFDGPSACSWSVVANTSSKGRSGDRLTCFKSANFNYTREECCRRPTCQGFDFTTIPSTGGSGSVGVIPGSPGSGCLFGNMTAVNWRDSNSSARWTLNKRAATDTTAVRFDLASLSEAGWWPAGQDAAVTLLR